MPRKISLFFILFISCIFCTAVSRAEVIDKILVIVNGEIITQSDVDKVLLPIYLQYKSRYSGRELEEKTGEVRDDVLRRLIEDKLLLTEAKRMEIRVAKKEIKGKIEEVKGRFSSGEEFETALAREGMSFSGLEEQFRERIMIDKFVNFKVQGKTSVSPSELLDYYETHLSEFRQAPEVRLRSILIKVGKACPEKEAMEIAQTVLYRIKEGSDFDLLAKQYSEGPYRDSGGDMGWVEKGQLMDRIDELVFRMEKGEISGILKTSLGLHIFKVEEKKDGRFKEFPEEKSRIEQILYSEKRKDGLRELIETLRENAYIAFR